MKSNIWEDEYYFNYADYGTGFSGVSRYYENINIQETLGPIIDQIKKYDMIRTRLENKGGRLDDLSEITKILTTSIQIKGNYRMLSAELSEQRKLRDMIKSVHWDLHLDVRQLHTHMPVYYLSRVHSDYWSEYSLIVEDIYMSPGYPMSDERFIKLMDAGHEVYYLRLSQFRESAERVQKVKGISGKKVDDLLYSLGRHIFQAAWHEDQRLGIITAKHLNLQQFHCAIELLYLCLSGELCEIRSAIDQPMLHFFEECYQRPAIRAFLGMLSTLDGGGLTELPQTATHLYKRLSQAFSRFLSTEIFWGRQKLSIPLWKLIYGNFSRLELVGGFLREEDRVKEAAKRLENEAREIILELLDTSSTNLMSFPQAKRVGNPSGKIPDKPE